MVTTNTVFEINPFNMDERIFINKCAEGFKISEFTRKRLLYHVVFAFNTSTDELIIDFLEKLTNNLDNLTDDEWNEIRQFIPFKLAYDESSMGGANDDEAS